MPIDDLDRFYQACNPNKVINFGDPIESKYYIDCSDVRGVEIIREMARTITKLSPNEPTTQLFTGHTGCGKTTELLLLKKNLEEDGFYVVYFQATDDILPNDVDLSDILLSIVSQVISHLEETGISIQSNYFVDLLRDIGNILTSPIEFQNIQLSLAIGQVTAKTKASPTLKDKLRNFLEPRITDLITSINQEIIKIAIDRLQNRGKKGLVIIIDNLDRLDPTTKPNNRTQYEYLFIDRGEYLTKLHCHVVYSCPIILNFSNDLLTLQNRFGCALKVLPMIQVKNRHGQEVSNGIHKMKQIILARAFPNIDTECQSNLIIEIFDKKETLNRFCKVSGGHLRNSIILFYSCLQKSDIPISYSCLEQVILEQRDNLLLGILPNQYELIKEIMNTKYMSGEEKYTSLVRSMFVFQYHDQSGLWFDINPIIASYFY